MYIRRNEREAKVPTVLSPLTRCARYATYLYTRFFRLLLAALVQHDVVQGACATIIRGSASLSLSITLLPWSSLSNVCRGHRFVLVGAYVGALNDNLVSLGVKLCVGRFRG